MDASNLVVSDVLSQEGHTIAYASQTLNPAEENYSKIEKKM